MLAFVGNRQKHLKKICTNLDGDYSRKFVEASKCAMERRYDAFKANHDTLTMRFQQIFLANYNNASLELKQFCCSFYIVKQRIPETIGQECAAHREILEEMEASTSPSEMNLICEEDDKLAKICPTLGPIEQPGKGGGGPVPSSLASQFKSGAGDKEQPKFTSAGLGMYLVATLGEPFEASPAAATSKP